MEVEFLKEALDLARSKTLRRSGGLQAVNRKRVYRLMKKHGLLLARHTGRRLQREHTGKVARCGQTSLVLRTGWSHLLDRRGGARRLRTRLS
jgi:hypothetical protein